MKNGPSIEIKKQILDFVRGYRGREGTLPSVSKIIRQVGINLTRFYLIFPGGIAEVARACNIPIPEKRIKATEGARRTREKKESEKDFGKLVNLTQQQEKELIGIAHLQNKDPLLVMDELLALHRQMVLRRIKLKDLEVVLKCLEEARKRKWAENEFVSFVTCLWNLRYFADLDFEVIKELNNFFVKAKKEGKNIEEIFSKFGKFLRIEELGIDLSIFDLSYLERVLKDAIDRKWKPEEFCEYITRSYNRIAELEEEKDSLQEKVNDIKEEIEQLNVAKAILESSIQKLQGDYEKKASNFELDFKIFKAEKMKEYEQEKARILNFDINFLIEELSKF